MTLPGPLVGWGGGAGEGDSLPHYSLPLCAFVVSLSVQNATPTCRIYAICPLILVTRQNPDQQYQLVLKAYYQ